MPPGKFNRPKREKVAGGWKLFHTEIKVKVKLSLCLIKYRAMKTYWGVEV
jgi:hypothetical protein